MINELKFNIGDEVYFQGSKRIEECIIASYPYYNNKYSQIEIICQLIENNNVKHYCIALKNILTKEEYEQSLNSPRHYFAKKYPSGAYQLCYVQNLFNVVGLDFYADLDKVEKAAKQIIKKNNEELGIDSEYIKKLNK